jgi:Delta7-sterol 5-desaturase
MDLVLEGFDTYLFDPLYASILPANPSNVAYKVAGGNGSTTLSSMREVPTAQYSTWEFKPASQFLSFPPSHFAYESSMPRDDIRRQFASLFLITWYVSWV